MPTRITVTNDAAEAQRHATLRNALFKATPAQIENYIDNNVTNLASAKEVLKVLAKAVALLARQQMKDDQ